MFACMQGHEDIVKLLLDNNADIHVASAEGTTALLMACRKKSPRIVEWLLQKGASPEAMDKEAGKNALHLVSINSNENSAAIARLLLDAVGDKAKDFVNSRMKDESTALMYAASEGTSTKLHVFLAFSGFP